MTWRPGFIVSAAFSSLHGDASVMGAEPSASPDAVPER